MRPFNRGEIVQAISLFLGMKGQADVQFDGQLLPVMQVGDLTDTPYLRYAIPVGLRTSRAADAGNVGAIVARAGANVALQVKKIVLSHTNAAAAGLQIRLMTAAEVATITLSTPSKMADLAADEQRVLRPSTLTTGLIASPPGLAIYVIELGVGVNDTFEFPDPGVILFPDKGAIAVTGDVVNEQISASFFGREWPLPG